MRIEDERALTEKVFKLFKSARASKKDIEHVFETILTSIDYAPLDKKAELTTKTCVWLK